MTATRSAIMRPRRMSSMMLIAVNEPVRTCTR